MKYWITTDTHFGHDEMMAKYCGRPENSTELIKRLIASTVREGDVLIHLGDVCIGGDAEHNAFFASLPCRKILVRGNHDSKSHAWYMAHGWDLCVDRFDMEYGGKRVAFTHMPVGWDGYFDLNVHGHLHNANHRRNEEEIGKTLNGYHRLVALEVTGYAPKNLCKLL